MKSKKRLTQKRLLLERVKLFFAEEIEQIKTKSTINKVVEALDPFIDDNAILRVGGRLRRSSLMYHTKFPILLPKKSHVSQLLVKHFHEISNHQGRGMSINTIRMNGYFIIGVRRIVASYIYNCVTCRRLRHHPQQQKMADLPPDRVEPFPPFTACASRIHSSV